jgi:hypothetical protein
MLLLAIGGLLVLMLLLAPAESRALVAVLWVSFMFSASAAAFLALIILLRDRQLPFARTCDELRKDIQCLDSVVRKKESM